MSVDEATNAIDRNSLRASWSQSILDQIAEVVCFQLRLSYVTYTANQ